MDTTLVLNSDYAPMNMITLSVIDWQEAIKGVLNNKYKVIHEHDIEISSPSTTILLPSIVVNKEYVKTSRKVEFTRRNVYLRDRYTCGYCNEIFPHGNLTWDHVNPKFNGGKTCWENMITSCGECNLFKGHKTNIKPKWMPFKPEYGLLIERSRSQPITIPDIEWNNYLHWPENLIKINPLTKKKIFFCSE